MLAKKMVEEEQEDLYKEDMEEELVSSTDEAEEDVDVKGKKVVKSNGLESLPGVGAATAEKLRLAGFDTVMAIAVATPGELVNAAGVSEIVARKLIQASRSSIDMGFESAEDILKKRDQVIRLSTGSKAFDTILAGGFETGAITECYGQYGSSKTQIAHQLCVSMIKQLPDAVAVYLDTENTFRPERIIQFAKGASLDPEVVLKQIKVARAYNSDHQMVLAEQIEDLITKKSMNVKLIVVDSLTAHFRAEYVGRGTLADRQQKLNKHMHALAKLADVYNLCVYVTNQVMAKPDQFFGDPTESIGGHIVGHNSTFRIYLRKGKKGTRVAKLLDAPNLADAEAVFVVKEEGIRDV